MKRMHGWLLALCAALLVGAAAPAPRPEADSSSQSFHTFRPALWKASPLPAPEPVPQRTYGQPGPHAGAGILRSPRRRALRRRSRPTPLTSGWRRT